MHHSLLTEENIKSIHREYRIRMITVFICVLCTVMLIGIVSLAPSYLNVYIINQVNYQKSSDLNKTHDPDLLLIQNELSSLTNYIDTAHNYVRTEPFSDVIEYISSLKNNIRITSFNIFRDNDVVIANIGGIANTRDELISFRDILQSEDNISVNLPVSDLTRSSNINFSMSINIK